MGWKIFPANAPTDHAFMYNISPIFFSRQFKIYEIEKGVIRTFVILVTHDEHREFFNNDFCYQLVNEF